MGMRAARRVHILSRMMTQTVSQILIVDDDNLVANGHARLLRRQGHEVATASSTSEAIAMMAAKTFDVVVSDIMMPDGDGIQMLRAAHTFDADLPVILMTGAPTIESAVLAVDSGAVKYLMKPVPTGELETAVEEAIAGFRLARHRRDAFDSAGHSVQAADALSALSSSFGSAVDQLWMAYQPIVSWSKRSVFAFEALLRTRDASFPNPGVLLSAAEQLHKLDFLGQAIRNTVATRLAEADPNTIAFINLHPEDLSGAALYSAQQRLSAFASRVVLEITERATLDEIQGLPARVATLRQMGYRIAIDDLGSGYSGLSSIVQLKPDIVKLDMSLVRGVEADPTKRKLVASLVNVCRDLGIQTVAEGIETAAERDALIDAGCDLLQGYLFARPAKDFPGVTF